MVPKIRKYLSFYLLFVSSSCIDDHLLWVPGIYFARALVYGKVQASKSEGMLTNMPLLVHEV